MADLPWSVRRAAHDAVDAYTEQYDYVLDYENRDDLVRKVLEAVHRAYAAAGYVIAKPSEFVEMSKQVLTEEGYAVVKVPEGVTVEHGARLEALQWPYRTKYPTVYAIEPAPKEATDVPE